MAAALGLPPETAREMAHQQLSASIALRQEPSR
jgi:hypothetical protein